MDFITRKNSIVPFFIGAIALGCYIAAACTPWFSIETPGTSCTQTDFHSWESAKIACKPEGCGLFCNIERPINRCPGSIFPLIFDECKERDIYFAARGLVAAAAAAVGVSVILLAIRNYGKIKPIGHYKLVHALGVLGTLCGIISFLVFCIGLPPAYKADYSPNTDCDNRCKDFTGTYTPLLGNKTIWGPTVGWILAVIGSAFGILYTLSLGNPF
jgi:hypothetical protein